MIPSHKKDVHYCIVHQRPSKLDGSVLFGYPYPACQYKHGTWFRHRSPDGDTHVQVYATEQVDETTCPLCLATIGKL